MKYHTLLGLIAEMKTSIICAARVRSLVLGAFSSVESMYALVSVSIISFIFSENIARLCRRRFPFKFNFAFHACMHCVRLVTFYT